MYYRQTVLAGLGAALATAGMAQSASAVSVNANQFLPADYVAIAERAVADQYGDNAGHAFYFFEQKNGTAEQNGKLTFGSRQYVFSNDINGDGVGDGIFTKTGDTATLTGRIHAVDLDSDDFSGGVPNQNIVAEYEDLAFDLSVTFSYYGDGEPGFTAANDDLPGPDAPKAELHDGDISGFDPYSDDLHDDDFAGDPEYANTGYIDGTQLIDLEAGNEWSFFKLVSGSLTGQGLFAGTNFDLEVDLEHVGPAFQSGIGANGKNINLGLSGWLKWYVQDADGDGYTGDDKARIRDALCETFGWDDDRCLAKSEIMLSGRGDINVDWALAPVPLPAGVWMLGTALAGLLGAGAWRRRLTA